MLGGRDPGRPVEGLVEGVAVEDVEAAERLLDLGIGPVRHEQLIVADANRRRVARGAQLVAAGKDPGSLRLAAERAVPRVRLPALVVGELLPAALVGVDQCHVLHVVSFHRCHA